MSTPRPPQVTVREVAKRAGVHAGTVSRALNPSRQHLLSNETIERVERAAQELGYSANRLASGLAAPVSRALTPSRQHLVRNETMERGGRGAKDLGYSPTRLAGGLPSARSFSVGVLTPAPTTPFFPPMVRGIEDRLLPHGYT